MRRQEVLRRLEGCRLTAGTLARVLLEVRVRLHGPLSHGAVTSRSHLPALSSVSPFLLSLDALRRHPQKFGPSWFLKISRHLVEKGLLALTPTEGRSVLPGGGGGHLWVCTPASQAWYLTVCGYLRNQLSPTNTSGS